MKFARSSIAMLIITVAIGAPTPTPVTARADDVHAPATTQSVAPSIWLLHLPGIGGLMGIDRAVTSGIVKGGLDAHVEIYDWTGADRGIAALTNVKRHEEQAQIVAERLIQHAREMQPGERTIITAHSAGTGIAITALERLPDDVMIDDLVMIASALSPEYDLSRALKHVRHKAYAFNSDLDLIVLGTGTKMMGTFDRIKTDAGGRVGFTTPGNAFDARQYEKFQQFPYDADWLRFHNAGEHIGAMSRTFGREVIARVLLGNGLPPHQVEPVTQPSTQRSR